MLRRLFLLHCLILASDEQLFDDVLFEIQNANRFNPFIFGPPPIFHVRRSYAIDQVNFLFFFFCSSYKRLIDIRSMDM